MPPAQVTSKPQGGPIVRPSVQYRTAITSVPNDPRPTTNPLSTAVMHEVHHETLNTMQSEYPNGVSSIVPEFLNVTTSAFTLKITHSTKRANGDPKFNQAPTKKAKSDLTKSIDEAMIDLTPVGFPELSRDKGPDVDVVEKCKAFERAVEAYDAVLLRAIPDLEAIGELH
ncbi:MAG: hypothetical protein Q9166_004980 [cf. Caloplaca sp. 2 TL-2023]